MKRDMQKTIENVTVCSKYDMTATDMTALHNQIKAGDVYGAIAAAFKFGYVMGHRATENGKYTQPAAHR